MSADQKSENGDKPYLHLDLKQQADDGVPALEACGLTLAWGTGAPVVSGISLRVDAGETVCLVGKSGFGKTTILHALAGLTTPREGRVLLHGRDVTGAPGQVGYMLQKDLLLESQRVVDNVALPLVLAETPRRQAREKALPLLERFGLGEVARAWPAQLSGGMRQRAAFARTCLAGTDVVLLDEPFSALDAITRADMRTWFRQEARELGLSTLMITHDADEACTMADRIYVLGRPEARTTGAVPVVRDAAPATIVAEIAPDRAPGASPADFALTSAFLDAKTCVLQHLA